MPIKKITASAVPRDFALTSDNLRRALLELQSVQSTIVDRFNSLHPLLDSLEGGSTKRTHLGRTGKPDPWTNGFDGSNILADMASTPDEHGGLLWNSLEGRAKTITEALLDSISVIEAKADGNSKLIKNLNLASPAASSVDATIRAHLNQLAADTIGEDYALGREWPNQDFTGSPVQTHDYSLKDLIDKLRSAMGGSLARDVGAYTFVNTNYLNAATSLHAALLALDAGLQDVETEWEESNGNIYRANGNVGIGTATPSRPLNVVSAENILIRAENTAIGGDCLSNYRTTHGTDKNIVLGLRGSDGAFVVSKGTELGQDDFFAISSAGDAHVTTGSLGVGTTSPDAKVHATGSIKAEANGKSLILDVEGLNSVNAGLWSSGSHLVLGSKTTNDLNIFLNDAETLQITRGTNPNRVSYTSHGGSGVHHFAGSVGVENNQPEYTLDVAPSSDSAFRVKNSTAGRTVNCRIENKGQDPGDGAMLALEAQPNAGDILLRFDIDGNENWSLGVDNSDSDKLKISNSSTLHTHTRVTLQGNKVGIGTTTPAKTLDVDGDIKVSGTTQINGVEYTWPENDGGNGQVLSTNGAGDLDWVAQGGGGGAASEPSFNIKSVAFNAAAGSRYGVDTSGAAVTATLPANPSSGDAIYFADAGGYWGMHNLTIARNGKEIMDVAQDMTVSASGESFGLFYNGTQWRVYG